MRETAKRRFAIFFWPCFVVDIRSSGADGFQSHSNFINSNIEKRGFQKIESN